MNTTITIACLFISLLVSRPLAAQQQDPNFQAKSNFHVQLLRGQKHFVFAMYGTPGNVEGLKQLVEVMKQKNLGNGFDPGPSARASSGDLMQYLATVGWPVICYPGYSDMQIKGGRSRLSDADEATMKILDDAGVFSAIQLGEWGYYFHNLSHNEAWFRAVYGNEYEKYKHLKKSPGLSGYDRLPTSRRECYDAVKDYFLSQKKAMRGRTISVTGHSHYEAYAAEWGTRVIGLELGENIAFTQSKIAFARGASRQWNRPWTVQVSPWFSGSCTTSGALRLEGKYARGLDAGHSLSFYQRMWLHSWFAGTAMVTPENSIATFFKQPHAPWDLTSHGEKAAEIFAFMRSHDRGVPHTPVAIVLDHLAGYNPYRGSPWGVLKKTPGDQQTYDLLKLQLFPGSDHNQARPNPSNPEASFLLPTPFGEMFDVLLSTASAETLQKYDSILLVGDINFSDDFVNRLSDSLRVCKRLLISPGHAKSLGQKLEQLKSAGQVEILAAWTNPATGRTTAISNDRLAQLNRELLPVTISGQPIGYQINRNQKGWVIELVNNRGVAKTPTQPSVVDPTAVAHVTLHLRIPIKSVHQWHTNQELPATKEIKISIPPGQTRFVELILF